MAICLGRVYGEIGDPVPPHWRCASRKILSYNDTQASGSPRESRIDFEIPGPGIYAVIFRPNYVAIA